MNPAVTLALAVVRRLKWTKVPAYCLAQLLGAFFASTVVYGIYRGENKFVFLSLTRIFLTITMLSLSFKIFTMES